MKGRKEGEVGRKEGRKDIEGRKVGNERKDKKLKVSKNQRRMERGKKNKGWKEGGKEGRKNCKEG